MTPDELMTALAEIIRQAVGAKGQWRKEQLTLEEWKAIDDAWLNIKQMNLRQLARKVTTDERNDI